MKHKKDCALALFYCQNTPDSGERERQEIEKEYGKSMRLFPIPCGGRLEPLHLLRALEEFADGAYVITCPEGACRYFEGNARAKKRVERAIEIIGSIGLEQERIGIIMGSREEPKSLSQLAKEVKGKIDRMGPSPVFRPEAASKEVEGKRKRRE